jgi:hypothetical protein
MASEKPETDNLKKGILLSSEYILPGGSNLLQGDLKQAGLHTVLGFAAKAMFGLPGLLIVSANSVSKALTGSHLYEHFNPERAAAPQGTTKTTAGAAPSSKKAKKKAGSRASKRKPAAEAKE